MEELLKELDKYYHINSDPRYRGEHPKCDEILDQLAEEFSKMKESDLRELLDGMDYDHLEQALAFSLPPFPVLPAARTTEAGFLANRVAGILPDVLLCRIFDPRPFSIFDGFPADPIGVALLLDHFFLCDFRIKFFDFFKSGPVTDFDIRGHFDIQADFPADSCTVTALIVP